MSTCAGADSENSASTYNNLGATISCYKSNSSPLNLLLVKVGKNQTDGKNKKRGDDCNRVEDDAEVEEKSECGDE